MQGSWQLMRPLTASAAFGASGGAAERMGIFVGIQQMEYGGLAAAHLGSTGAFTATGTPFSVAAGRLSFHYGLKGPPSGAEALPRHEAYPSPVSALSGRNSATLDATDCTGKCS
jgi:hypothetical protein